MAEGLLAQVNPLANTDTLLYRCPDNGAARLTNIFICGTTAATFRMRIAFPEHDTAAQHQYIYFNTNLAANTTVSLITDMPLSDRQSIWVLSTAGDTAFSALGFETDNSEAIG